MQLQNRWFVLLALLPSCKREAPQPVEMSPVTPSVTASVTASVAAPAARVAVPPKREIPWALPQGPLTGPEQPLPGTWVATVGDYATRSAFMADKVMFDVSKKEGGGFAAIADAITNDNRIKTNCIWLELHENRTGFRRECAMINGQASALDKTDVLSGKKGDMGTAFEWYWDAATKAVHVRFAEDMIVPASDGKSRRDLRFRTWTLTFTKQVGNGIEIAEAIPEHDYELPVHYVYEIFPGRYLDQ